MKSIRFGLSLALVLLFAVRSAPAQSPAEKSFAQLKTLVGSWNGRNAMGKTLRVSFRTTSAGSAVLSEVHSGRPQPKNMISMFHLDGDRLLATHYCSAGNQPRMAASTSANGKTITFDFVDATNLRDLNDGHMRRVVIAIINANHHTETWTFVDHGKETTEVYDLHRSGIARNQGL
jgi:hypothetical protein